MSGEAHRSAARQAFRIDGCEVDSAANLVERDGETVHLEPKVMGLLVYLAERAGEVVSREELEERIWAGTVVGYDSLTQSIAKLRRTFEDDPHHPRVIETIPKTGYRLIADVERLNARGVELPGPAQLSREVQAPKTRRPRRWYFVTAGIGVVAVTLATILVSDMLSENAMQPESSSPPSLIVLPFRNIGDDPSQKFFAVGMTEDLITDLSRLDGLSVVGRNTAFAYQDVNAVASELAEELGVHYVLEGSVRRQGDRIRVSAQLVDAATDRQIWGNTYDRELTDVFAVQDDLKKEIVAAFSVQLDTGERATLYRRPTENVDAYELYLRARHALQQGSLRSMRLAYWALEKALELQPNFGAALALLADTYARDYPGVVHALEWERPPAITKSRAEQFARRAQSVVPAIAAPEIALARLRLGELRFEDALSHASRAVELEPRSTDAHVVRARTLSALGRHQEALAAADAAYRLDPTRTPNHHAARGMALFGLGDYTAAHESFSAARGTATVHLRWQDTALAIASAGYVGTASKVIEEIPYLSVPKAVQWATPLPIFADAGDQGRLTEGLRLAGLPEYAGDLISVAPRLLDEGQIEDLLFGHKASSFCHNVKYSPLLRISSQGHALWQLRHDISETGQARVEGGRLCLRFPVLSRNRDLCFRIYPNEPPAVFSKDHAYVMDGPLLCFFTPTD